MKAISFDMCELTDNRLVINVKLTGVKKFKAKAWITVKLFQIVSFLSPLPVHIDIAER